MKNIRTGLGRAFAGLGGLALLAFCVGLGAQQIATPKYKYDGDWPKPLPNNWKMGGVTGLAVDKDDNVWVLDRPNDLRDMELKAEITPKIADCCTRPPSMIHIDKSGTVIGSFDPPQGHGMAVDSKGFVYVGNAVHGLNTVRKYDPNSGKLLAEIPRAPESQAGGGGGEFGAGDETPVNRTCQPHSR
jgi:DNA-binding beta-propeller fold protein YncE